MSNPIKIILILLLVLFFSPALAQTSKTFLLKDGTRIQGRIAAVGGGKYIIQSSSLGQVSINEDDVVSMSSGEQASGDRVPRPEANRDFASQIQAAQGNFMANPQAMAEVEALAGDPEVLMLISDPDFQRAINSRDLVAIQSNPKVNRLMTNPKVQALIRKFLQGQAR